MKRITRSFIAGLVFVFFSIFSYSNIVKADAVAATSGSSPLTSMGALVFTGGLLLLPILLFSSDESSSVCTPELQRILDDYRVQHNIPAISMMSVSPSLQSEQKVYSCSSGTYTRESAVPINPGSRFEMASLTKSMIATVILKLEAEGRLNIFDTVGARLGMGLYPAWNGITIRQLLNMTAGAVDYIDVPFLQQVMLNPGHFWSLRDLTDHAFAIMPNIIFPAGTNWQYINTNYELAGLIIEAASGRSVKENLEELIFRPLNMTRSFYDPTILPINIPDIVRGYTTNPASPFYGHNILDFSISMANSAGAVISTPADYLKFVQALFSGKLLPPAQFNELTSIVCRNAAQCVLGQPLPPGANADGYGLGVQWLYNPYLGMWYWVHQGENSGGYYNIFSYIPQNGFTIVVLGGLSDANLDGRFYFDLVAQVYSCFY